MLCFIWTKDWLVFMVFTLSSFFAKFPMWIFLCWNWYEPLWSWSRAGVFYCSLNYTAISPDVNKTIRAIKVQRSSDQPKKGGCSLGLTGRYFLGFNGGCSLGLTGWYFLGFNRAVLWAEWGLFSGLYYKWEGCFLDLWNTMGLFSGLNKGLFSGLNRGCFLDLKSSYPLLYKGYKCC